MNPRFHCSLRTKLSLLRDPDVFARMWSALAVPEVGAVTFDPAERNHQHDFTPDPTKAFALLDEHSGLFVGGDRDGFLFEACYGGGGTNYTGLYFDESVDGSSWLPWILRLVDELPVLFGGCYSMTEHDAKHRVVKEYPSGGSSEGAVGMSSADFQKYLPAFTGSPCSGRSSPRRWTSRASRNCRSRSRSFPMVRA